MILLLLAKTVFQSQNGSYNGCGKGSRFIAKSHFSLYIRMQFAT